MRRLHLAMTIALPFAVSAQAELLTLHGKVLMRNSADGHAVIAQVDPSNATDETRHYFALQVDSAPAINVTSDTASVTFAPDQVTITAGDKHEVITLSISEVTPRSPENSYSVISFRGVGLAHITATLRNVKTRSNATGALKL